MRAYRPKMAVLDGSRTADTTKLPTLKILSGRVASAAVCVFGGWQGAGPSGLVSHVLPTVDTAGAVCNM
jgi:hypothetical protein